MPEILSPVGSFEKLFYALYYGADAIYLSGQFFGLRTASKNFSLEELKKARLLCDQHQVKMYMTLNGFLHDEDLLLLKNFLKDLTFKPDAFIISDLGVIKTVQSLTNIPIHLSTQASCINRYQGQIYKDLGITRLILGREASLEDGAKIKEATKLEVEMFIHGSTCMAYSGHCTISNYTQGRDSNRGGCSHSCRFSYEKKGTFLSSKDLYGLDLIPKFLNYGIDSLKIEGRMKSPLYLAATTYAYKQALKNPEKISSLKDLLDKIPHREYSSLNLLESSKKDVYLERDEKKTHQFLGSILDTDEDFAYLYVKNTFSPHTKSFVLQPEGLSQYTFQDIYSLSGEKIEKTKPSTLVKIPKKNLTAYSLLHC